MNLATKFAVVLSWLAVPAGAQVFDVSPDGGLSPAPVAGAMVLAPAGQRPEPFSAPGPGLRHPYHALVVAAAQRHDLHPALLNALVAQESRGRQDAVSPKGAIGLAQLMPATARQLGVDPHDPAGNLEGGARYLRAMLDRFGGNIELALAAYNAGPRRVERAGGVPAIAETRRYVASILARLAYDANKGLETDR